MSVYRFKNKAALRAALVNAGIPLNKRGEPNKAEIERRLEVLLGRQLGASRQYLSRVLADDGDATTSQHTAEGLCYIARVNLDDMFDPESVSIAS